MHRTLVPNPHRYSHVLDIAVLVPYQQLAAAGNVTECSIEYALIMLECKQVLFLFVARAAYEPHPA